jgi:hypothetical protein
MAGGAAAILAAAAASLRPASGFAAIHGGSAARRCAALRRAATSSPPSPAPHQSHGQRMRPPLSPAAGGSPSVARISAARRSAFHPITCLFSHPINNAPCGIRAEFRRPPAGGQETRGPRFPGPSFPLLCPAAKRSAAQLQSFRGERAALRNAQRCGRAAVLLSLSVALAELVLRNCLLALGQATRRDPCYSNHRFTPKQAAQLAA